jgi:hypothetical protein
MIKKYKDYLKEEIDFKNLFRRDKKKLPREHDEIDPYHEEIWDVEELNPILHKADQQGKPYEQIKILNCSFRNLNSLNGIENLTNLEILGCYINNLTSLKGIENLINLKELYCFNNNLTSLNEIKNLIRLEYLDCRFNNFSNEYKKYLIDYCKKKKIKLSI